MKIVIEVNENNEDKAQAFVEDVQKTNSICFLDIDGMDTEFGVTKIEVV